MAMSAEHAGGAVRPEERRDWLDDPVNVDRIVKALGVACVLVVLADFFYHKHGHFGFQSLFGFDAVFGFLAYVGLVSVAKLWRRVVMRSEDYYD
jgi:hypothetical protein